MPELSGSWSVSLGSWTLQSRCQQESHALDISLQSLVNQLRAWGKHIPSSCVLLHGAIDICFWYGSLQSSGRGTGAILFITDLEVSLLLTQRVNKPTEVIFRLLSQKRESLGVITWASILVILLLLLPNNLLFMYHCTFVKKILSTGIACITLYSLLVFCSFIFIYFLWFLNRRGPACPWPPQICLHPVLECDSLLFRLFFPINSIGKQEFLAIVSVSFPKFLHWI